MSVHETVLFVLARLIFGGVLTFMAIDGFRRNEGRVAGARSQNVPYPEYLVPIATGFLLVGSLGIIAWVLPHVAAICVAIFFLGVTPKMHAFWREEPENYRAQRGQFLKNSAILAGAMLFLYVALTGL